MLEKIIKFFFPKEKNDYTKKKIYFSNMKIEEEKEVKVFKSTQPKK